MIREPEVRVADASEVRAWARKRGIEVGNRGHLSQQLIDQFNWAHRKKFVVAKNNNPSVQHWPQPEEVA